MALTIVLEVNPEDLTFEDLVDVGVGLLDLVVDPYSSGVLQPAEALEFIEHDLLSGLPLLRSPGGRDVGLGEVEEGR